MGGFQTPPDIVEHIRALEQRIAALAVLAAPLGGIYRGAGSPAGVLAAPVGSLYLRSDGGASTTLYVKESGTGTSGWVAK